MKMLLCLLCLVVGLNLNAKPITVAIKDIEISGKDFKKTAGLEIVDLLNAFFVCRRR